MDNSFRYLYRSLALKCPALVSIFRQTGFALLLSPGGLACRSVAANLDGSQLERAIKIKYGVRNVLAFKRKVGNTKMTYYCTLGSCSPPVSQQLGYFAPLFTLFIGEYSIM